MRMTCRSDAGRCEFFLFIINAQLFYSVNSLNIKPKRITFIHDRDSIPDGGVQTGSVAHPSPVHWVTWLFTCGRSGRSLMLIIQVNIVPWLEWVELEYMESTCYMSASGTVCPSGILVCSHRYLKSLTLRAGRKQCLGSFSTCSGLEYYVAKACFVDWLGKHE
jgi:hypothetical protein